MGVNHRFNDRKLRFTALRFIDRKLRFTALRFNGLKLRFTAPKARRRGEAESDVTAIYHLQRHVSDIFNGMHVYNKISLRTVIQ